VLSTERATLGPVSSKTKNAKLLSMKIIIACLTIRLSISMGPVLRQPADSTGDGFQPALRQPLTITNEKPRLQPLLLPPKQGLSQHLLKTVFDMNSHL
jgi:hypothetical protein